jgi:hypothetical protein
VVNRGLARLVAFFILVAAAIEGVNLLNHIAPVVLLTDAAYSGAFTQQQLQAQAYLPLELQSLGFAISLLAIGGLCYLTNSFALSLSPGFAAHLVPYILVPSFVGETSLSLWLTIAGDVRIEA